MHFTLYVHALLCHLQYSLLSPLLSLSIFLYLSRSQMSAHTYIHTCVRKARAYTGLRVKCNGKHNQKNTHPNAFLKEGTEEEESKKEKKREKERDERARSVIFKRER